MVNITFDELLNELLIQDAESGADREMGYNPENTEEKAYDIFYKNQD